jgi:hypothetical protein
MKGMWPQIASVVLGLSLMAAPDLADYSEPARSNSLIFGPVIASTATIAIWETTRGLRWVNLPLGLWLIAAPIVLLYDEPSAIAHSVIVGLLLIPLARMPVRLEKRYGDGWASLLRR